ncbi:bile acid:sodium symporter family protein [Candidatus Pelagibacter bacterium]|jgi:BASS family bile acid:Na+ symporter|nr:bile acid:sodium symporter family protein [Candidatus Pelagibacter bacterium]|tara:strand:- start:1045 stop:1905 length:861 start_codon:yes stop_codon:yes gene_type:complete
MEIVTKIAPIALALMMLGLGTSLTINDFTRVIKNPKDFLVGLICQLILLPIIAFILIKLLNTPAELAVGVMIIAAAPGGVTSNIYTKFANGDVALSISLTAIISLISIITVPLIVFKSAEILEVSFMSKNISMIGISIKMFFVVTVPVIIGMVIRRFFNDYIVLKSNLITKVSVILFVIVLFGIYISEWDKIIPFLTSAGLIATTLNITMMFVGYYVAKIFATGIAQQRCIALECGLQNGTLAVFIATQLGSEVGALSPLIVPTAAYGLVMFATSLIFLFIVKKNT